MTTESYNKPILFGSIVGVIEHIAILPLRTILDHQQYFNKQTTINQLLQTKFNTIPSLYKGTSICLSGVALGHVGLFTMLEYSKQNEKYSYLYGALGKFIHDLCIVPTDTIRMYGNVHSISLTKSIKGIYKSSGYKGFFKGLIPASISNLPAGAIEFTVLSYFRKYNKDSKQSDNVYYTFLSGGIAGLCSSVVTSPIDTVKTYVQCSQKSIKESIKTIYKERGIKGFFRGIPNKIISASLSFGVYEYLSDTFDIDDHH